MGSQREYYTLIASLPPLPRFDRADRLPITRERLKERLRMLEPEDAEVVERGEAFFEWQRQSVTRTDSEMVADYERLAALIEHPALKAIFEFGTNVRTIMAALRRRHRGLPAPTGGEPWGVGPLVWNIVRNWDDPNFKLAGLYPWLPQAREHIEAGEALALEGLLTGLSWDRADRFGQESEFGFQRVLAYRVKWDIVQRWLFHDSEAAKERFEELVVEVTDEKEKVFGETT
jgi:hypothetical protein